MNRDRSLLFLIGARGTGKSSVARLLAGLLGCAWCDADTLLEERAHKTIRQIFADEGEAGFRDREAAILGELAGCRDLVVATGGGVVLRAENRTSLQRGTVIWLRGAPAVLWRRMQADATTAERRPNLAQGGLAEMEAVLEARTPLYAACANYAVDTDELTPDAIGQCIIAWLTSAARSPDACG
jgi:shikimate kinase